MQCHLTGDGLREQHRADRAVHAARTAPAAHARCRPARARTGSAASRDSLQVIVARRAADLVEEVADASACRSAWIRPRGGTARRRVLPRRAGHRRIRAGRPCAPQTVKPAGRAVIWSVWLISADLLGGKTLEQRAGRVDAPSPSCRIHSSRTVRPSRRALHAVSCAP